MIRIENWHPRVSRHEFEAAVGWASWKILGPLAGKIKIDIAFDDDETIVTNKHGEDTRMYGVLNGWSIDEYEIIIWPDTNEEECLKTLFHEMVHVRQYALAELSPISTKKEIYRWRGTVVDMNDCLYRDLPWELEAVDLEEKLYEEWKNG